MGRTIIDNWTSNCLVTVRSFKANPTFTVVLTDTSTLRRASWSTKTGATRCKESRIAGAGVRTRAVSTSKVGVTIIYIGTHNSTAIRTAISGITEASERIHTTSMRTAIIGTNRLHASRTSPSIITYASWSGDTCTVTIAIRQAGAVEL